MSCCNSYLEFRDSMASTSLRTEPVYPNDILRSPLQSDVLVESAS